MSKVRMHFLVVAIALSTLATVLAPTARADSSLDAFDLRYLPATQGEFYFTILDPEGQPFSSLAVQPGMDSNGKRGEWKYCDSPTDPVCLGNPSARSGFMVLGLCEDANDEDCVTDLKISRSGGSFESAKFIRRLDSNLTLDPDPASDFPGGSTASLWQESQDPSKKYLVLAGYGGGFWENKFSPNSMIFSIIPVREASGNYQAARFDKEKDPCCRISWGSDFRAFWTENGRAGFRVNFDEDVELTLTTRVKKSFSGWFKGRIKDPSVDIKSFSGTNDIVEISGKPVSVAVLGVKRKVSEMTPKEYRWFQGNGQSNGTTPTRPDAEDIFEFIDNFRDDARDTAMGVTTAWSIGSTSWGNENACLNDKTKLLGIVSTNAMGFDGSSPKFIDGGLEYRVSSLHFQPDGKTPLQGTYDLLVRSDVARCLYGFSSAPVSASISVLGESGSSTTTTSRMIETDGWLKFGAYGFTFSEKKIRVTLSQDPEPKVKETTQTDSSVNQATVKKPFVSASCAKGKKQAKALKNGKCPKGYKKK